MNSSDKLTILQISNIMKVVSVFLWPKYSRLSLKIQAIGMLQAAIIGSLKIYQTKSNFSSLQTAEKINWIGYKLSLYGIESLNINFECLTVQRMRNKSTSTIIMIKYVIIRSESTSVV